MSGLRRNRLRRTPPFPPTAPVPTRPEVAGRCPPPLWPAPADVGNDMEVFDGRGANSRPALRPRSARDPCLGGGPGCAGPPGSACESETRGSSCVSCCWADRCVSRCPRRHPQNDAPRRTGSRVSIAGGTPLPAGAVPVGASLRLREKVVKTRFPLGGARGAGAIMRRASTGHPSPFPPKSTCCFHRCGKGLWRT